MVTVGSLLDVLLNGLTIGMVYVLVAAGLSIVFGVMDVLNVSHGELFALGAYLAFTIISATNPSGFWLALVLAPIAVGIVGMVIERFTIRRIYDRGHLSHVLLTFGFLLILYDSKRIIWGKNSKLISVPASIDVPVTLFGYSYPMYNYFMIAAGVVLALATWALLEHTEFGLVVRAGSQDRSMVRNLGIDIDRYYTLVFGVGAALAAFAGVVLGGYQNVNLEMGNSVIISAFVIVVLGGLGSFRGAIVGGLAVGVIQSVVATYVPQLQGTVIFLVMIGVLLVRPQGLFGTPAFEAPTGGDGNDILKGGTGGLLGDRLRTRFGAALVVLVALVPVGAKLGLYTDFATTLFIEMLIWALFALSLDLILGYTGLISLGHTLFYGVGAYTTVLAFMHVSNSVFVAVLLALAVCALVALVVGHLAIRVSGVYFVMITLAFAELVHSAVFKLGFTGGSNGLFPASQPLYGIAGVGVHLTDIAVGVPGLRFSGDSLFYYVLLVVVVGAYLLSRRLMNAPFGSVLQAIRESESRAKFIGYDVRSFKRRAFVVSGTLGGLAGALFAVHNTYAATSLLSWINSGDVIVMAVLGGVGTLYGPMIGAGVFIGFESMLSSAVPFWRLLLGVFFVLVVLFAPKGLVSMPARVAAWADSGERAPEPDAADGGREVND